MLPTLDEEKILDYSKCVEGHYVGVHKSSFQSLRSAFLSQSGLSEPMNWAVTPVSLNEISKVGFNAQGNRALVYKAEHCGALCGLGAYYILEPDEAGDWQIRYWRLEWIS